MNEQNDVIKFYRGFKYFTIWCEELKSNGAKKIAFSWHVILEINQNLYFVTVWQSQKKS